MYEDENDEELGISIEDADNHLRRIQTLTQVSIDLRNASFSDQEARLLVDLYYTVQGDRKRSKNQIRAMEKEGETPSIIINHYAEQFTNLEKDIKKGITSYANKHPMAIRVQECLGIGPIIAAGLVAHIDIDRAPTVGHIWRFAGLDSTVTWEKGQKRPFNAKLKTLCWKIGESFCKIHNRPGQHYGKIYEQRKLHETLCNDAGNFADQAAYILATKNFKEKSRRPRGEEDDDVIPAKKYYEQGKLPPGHIEQRAKRYAVKIFLSHFHQIWFEMKFEKKAPIPYIIAHGNHNDYLPPLF